MPPAKGLWALPHFTSSTASSLALSIPGRACGVVEVAVEAAQKFKAIGCDISRCFLALLTAMRNFIYFVIRMGFMAIGLLAMDSYPKYEGAGVVLGAFVFVASTAMVALIHYIRSAG